LAGPVLGGHQSSRRQVLARAFGFSVGQYPGHRVPGSLQVASNLSLRLQGAALLPCAIASALLAAVVLALVAGAVPSIVVPAAPAEGLLSAEVAAIACLGTSGQDKPVTALEETTV
jgi:hypothetical protein